VQIAKDLEVLGVEIEGLRCPLSDLAWQPEKEVQPTQISSQMSWEEKLDANPSLKTWAENYPQLAKIQRQKWEASSRALGNKSERTP
tara:strand:- start:160 stop:420 length:261 start_codon:yes stop_codon:yes gene_type:complete